MNIAQETLDLLNKLGVDGLQNLLAKSITTATGLVAFDLQAPAKNLYPVFTPIIKKLPRVPGKGGVATNWRQVSAIQGSGWDAMGWVPEGQRSARMSYTTSTIAASYVTIGEEDQVSFEGVTSAEGFEDIRATAAMRLLQKMMLKEESAVLGGNANSIALGTAATPVLAAAGSGATLPALTYSVIVIALTYEGMKNSTLGAGVADTKVITGADGLTYTLKGGSSQKSANATQAVTLGQILSCSTTAVAGAAGYAWFVGAAAAERLEAITTLNSATFSVPLLGTGQTAASTGTADNSQNTTLAFNGLMANAWKAGSSAYLKTLATGVAGTGTFLTASGRGSINEIDQMFLSMWNSFQTSPTAIYANAQEVTNMTNKVLTAASGPLVRYNQDAGSKEPYMIVANGVIQYYYNPFGQPGGTMIPIITHPLLPAGTIYAHCDSLPPQYISNQVPNVAEVHVRRDYYEIDWPLRTRQYEMGVYAEEVLACYAPFALGIINNIGNG